MTEKVVVLGAGYASAGAIKSLEAQLDGGSRRHLDLCH